MSVRKHLVVYRFVCPDGRSYVGGCININGRPRTIHRSNKRVQAAFKQYPCETWTFEILERLPVGCPECELREAEQRHIDRLRTMEPEFGFNVDAAIGTTTKPGSGPIYYDPKTGRWFYE
jgi:hypothetical protein